MDLSTLDKDIRKFKKTKENGRTFVTAVKQLRLIRKLRKYVRGIDNTTGFTQNQIRYIKENFPKIEEIMLEDVKAFARLKNVRTVKGEPLYYLVFLNFLSGMNMALDGEKLEEIFETVNRQKPYTAIVDSESFLLYMRAVLCRKICLFYIDNSRKTCVTQEGYLKNLFVSLDEVLSLDKEECIKSNETEKLLLLDKIYSMSTIYTKESIRKNLENNSRKSGVSEYEYAKKLVCDRENFTGVLCDKPFGGQVYLVLHFFMTALFTFFLCMLSPLFLIAFIPVYRCVKVLLDRFFTRFAVKNFTEPALELEKIPDDSGVLVTITTLLTGGKNDAHLFERLEKMYLSNGGENVYFSILCDLADSDEKEKADDRKIIKAAVESILKLRKKYGDVFFLFLRDRVYSPSQQCFMAPERKRGAVNTLCSCLCNKSDGFSSYGIKPDEGLCKRLKYVFTLDSDTNLAFDCVRKAAGIMLHPNNKPVFDEKKGRVVKGYGILQPKMQTCLEAANRTVFTGIMCGPGGIDSYSSAGYDLAFALFGRGVFCGKGMFDKECFYKALCKNGEFKKDTVLSHDAPEGAVLRCISTSRITLTDGFPREQMSYNKRRHRWVRGDIQNLHFFGKHRLNGKNERVKNGIDFVSKYLMAENIADSFLQIFSLVLIFLSLSAEDKTVRNMLVTVAVSPYFMPAVYTLLSSLKKAFLYNLRRLFFSKGIYSGLWNGILRAFLEVSFLPQSAYVCFDGIVRAIYRMFISQKKTLEWLTAAQSDSESKDGILGYVKKNLFSTFCAVTVITLSQNSFVKLIGLCWLALPFTAYYTGKQRLNYKAVVGEKDRHFLLESLRDMWQYFEDNVTDKTHYLPPDNVAFHCTRKISRMTSPTNIGLYLASAVAARKSGLLSTPELEEICTNTLDTLLMLPKCKGLLYNWYDVTSAKPLNPRFVSSVDEGNYIACLYVLLGGLKEYADECRKYDSVMSKIKKLIAEADLSRLYNDKRKLFYIGFTHENDGSITYSKNCYDMLMSETRILSYVAVAQGYADASHFSRLSRPLVESDRYAGLASWSGTVFEYYMPALFLPVFYGSLSFEALKFAFLINVKHGVFRDGKRVFGISESCYNCIDDAGNYMYHAFGCEKLALCVFGQEQVISPYSSYLMLEADIGRVVENLRSMRDMGMYGKYGFYESCDFERHKRDKEYGIVNCFMSHHVGMSICAIGNLLFDGFIRNCFMADGKNMSATEFLEEKIPSEVYIKKRARRHYSMLSKPILRPKGFMKTENEKVQEIDNGESASAEKTEITLKIDNREFNCDAESGEYPNFGIEWLTAKREPMKIITAKSVSRGKVCLEVVCKNAKKVQTEAGGIIFYLEGKMCFVFGFYVDDAQGVSQCLCLADNEKKKASFVFDIKKENSVKSECVFAAGYAKSFESIHIVRKRITTDREKIINEGKRFAQSLIIDKNLVPSFLECECNKAEFIIPVKKSISKQTAMTVLKLVYTQSPLKEYAVINLVHFLKRCDKNEHEANFLICAVFCDFCMSLEEEKLCSFIKDNTESYRLVIKHLMECKEKNGMKPEEKEIYIHCLLQLEKICNITGDEAAQAVVSSAIDESTSKKG